MLRFHLPPNFAAAAARNAVAVKVELTLAEGAPPAGLLPALALLQRWCGPKPPVFLQLTRAQLRDLANVVGDQPIFVENGRPVAWNHDALVAEPKPISASSAPTPIENPKSKIQNKKSAEDALLVDGSEHFLAITPPSRDSLAYAGLVELLKSNGFTLEPSNRKWWLRDRHKTLNFLATHGARLRENLGADFTPNFEKNTAHLRAAEIAATVAETGDNFSVNLGLRAGSADEAQLRTAVATGRGYLESDGKIFLLDSAKLARLAQAQANVSSSQTSEDNWTLPFQ